MVDVAKTKDTKADDDEKNASTKKASDLQVNKTLQPEEVGEDGERPLAIGNLEMSDDQALANRTATPGEKEGITHQITDDVTRDAAVQADKFVAQAHAETEFKPSDGSLTDDEVERELSRKADGGNPLGTVVPERGSVDWNRSRA